MKKFQAVFRYRYGKHLQTLSEFRISLLQTRLPNLRESLIFVSIQMEIYFKSCVGQVSVRCMFNIKIRRKFQICFFVTNVTFLEQQAKLFEKFVGHRWKVVFLSGITVNTPIAETIETYDVIVITPQLIVSAFP